MKESPSNHAAPDSSETPVGKTWTSTAPKPSIQALERAKETRGVEIGTADGETASKKTTDAAVKCLSRYFPVEVNKKYKGLKHGSIITTHYRKDPQGSYLVEAIQMEFGLKERSTSRSKTIDGITEIVNLVNREST